MARDIEARADAPNVPEAHRPSAEEFAGAQTLREQVGLVFYLSIRHPCALGGIA